ncbi:MULTISPECIES: hypothetical protein [unclassified Ensifer]|uniref:hypothetical protein n=1 Tax=unclassified Ensifer TaxID=2633371 RepID=UPI0013796183|nr:MULTISPECIES: hypothetical protein [unclassified Ensifer]
MESNLTLGERVVREASDFGDFQDHEKPNLLTINKNDLQAIVEAQLEWWLINVYDVDE